MDPGWNGLLRRASNCIAPLEAQAARHVDVAAVMVIILCASAAAYLITMLLK